MILNVQSEFPALSEYIIDELVANIVNDRVFTVVDRTKLDNSLAIIWKDKPLRVKELNTLFDEYK